MDIESVRYNERFKAFANFADNSALAFLVASVARAFGDSGADILTGLSVALGVAFLWMAWHIRGLIQSEDE